MRSLFFWRGKRQVPAAAQPAGRPVQPSGNTVPPVAAGPESSPADPPQPAPLRRVFAVALQDERAVLPPAADPVQMKLLLAAGQACATIGSESRYTPRRPSMLAQLLDALSDEDASLRELSRIVARDAELTGNLLRRANSPMYRVSSTPVESIERAAALLGTTGIRTLLAASLMQPLATGPASGLGRFGEITWEHSLYSASAAEAWAARKSDADPFTAHLLALMHGLGLVAVYRVLADLQAAGPGLAASPAIVADALETNAAVVAARIASHWGLSERTQQALEAQSSAAPVGASAALAQSLRFGLLAGAATLLCCKRQMSADDGLAALDAGGFSGEPATRIWDRLQLAYVRP